jgi:hypothetical protein
LKKAEVVRFYKFSDGKLITVDKEKITFMRRDATAFTSFSITAALVKGLETSINTFTNFITDTEALGDQTGITDAKNAKAEQVRVAIRSIMAKS